MRCCCPRGPPPDVLLPSEVRLSNAEPSKHNDPPVPSRTRRSDDYFKVDALLESVASGAIAPLRGRWVVELQARGGRLARRQDLPPEAFWTASDLGRCASALGSNFGLLFVALSYRWLSREHCDPDAFHLDIIAMVARFYMGMGGKLSPTDPEPAVYHRMLTVGGETAVVPHPGFGLKSPLVDAFAEAGLGECDFALFWDFGSLHQEPRTVSEAALFREGLRFSNVWYGHSASVCWMQTELPDGFEQRMAALGLAQSYADSGWCFVEQTLASFIKRPGRLLDLGLRLTPWDFDGRPCSPTEYGKEGVYHEARLDAVCAATQQPPISPADARHLLQTSKVFTSRADVEVVAGLYREFVECVIPRATRLTVGGSGEVSGESLNRFLRVLPMLTKLEYLQVCVSASDAVQVTRAVAECNASAARNSGGRSPILTLNVERDLWYHGGATTMGDSVRGQELPGDLPIDRLAGTAAPPECRSISLLHSGRSDRSALAIAHIIEQNEHLTDLDVRQSCFSKAAAETLATAVCACASLVTFGPIPVAKMREDALTSLSLQNQSMLLVEVTVVARLLEGCNALLELDLQFNGVQAEGALALAAAIATGARRLRRLDLSRNPISYREKGSEANEAARLAAIQALHDAAASREREGAGDGVKLEVVV
jgi:hypothetical protein